jgi:hypothetical protein
MSQFQPESRLRRVTLATTRDCAPTPAPFFHADLWRSVDDVIASLEAVFLTVKVSLSSYGVVESEAGVVALKQYLPRLAVNARLQVTATKVSNLN